MREFYNAAGVVMDKFKVMKTDLELYMLMACKNQVALYACLILDELK